MKLKVPVHKQPKNSMTCGLYCVKMLLEYYKIKASMKDITKTAGLYKPGTYTADIAKYLKQKGFKVTLWLPNTKWFHPAAKKMNRKERIKHLKKLLKKTKKRKDQMAIKALLRWLEDGGKLRIEPVSLADIKTEIRNRHPPILTVDRKVFYGKKPGNSGHFVLATGYENGKIIVNDSQGYYGGVKAYPEKDVLYALYSWSAPVIFAEPKK